MIRVLIVDDDTNKQGNIARVVQGASNGNKNIEILTAQYLTDAKSILRKNSVDVLILDICIPQIAGAENSRDGGIKLLEEVRGSERYIFPNFVVAISEYKDLIKEFNLSEGLIHKSLLYSTGSDKWKKELEKTISMRIEIEQKRKHVRENEYDVAVICALEEELKYMKLALEDCSELTLESDDYIYYVGLLRKGDKTLKVVMANSQHMGMVPAATLASNMIYHFCPKLVAMTGIAAGIRGKNDYGDIVCAEYAWDYRAGKEVSQGGVNQHKNTIQQIGIDASLIREVKRLAQDTEELQKIESGFMGEVPKSKLKMHVGAVASGASVVANEQIIADISNQIRDVLAVEMEIYGFYYAARWALKPKPLFIALKSICDFADATKNDSYHGYASYTSAMALIKLITKYCDFL